MIHLNVENMHASILATVLLFFFLTLQPCYGQQETATFLIRTPLSIGPKKIGGPITAQQAKNQLRTRFIISEVPGLSDVKGSISCDEVNAGRFANYAMQFDKFAEIAVTELRTTCASLSLLSNAKFVPVSNWNKDFSEFTNVKDLPQQMIPGTVGNTDRIRISANPEKAEFAVEVLTADTDFFNGMEAMYREVSRGDFDGKRTQEILFIEEYSGISANFSKCNLMLVSKSRSGRIRVVFTKAMGRCG